MTDGLELKLVLERRVVKSAVKAKRCGTARIRKYPVRGNNRITLGIHNRTGACTADFVLVRFNIEDIVGT